MFEIFRRKASKTVTLITAATARWSPRDYATFAKEGYAENVIVYQCIRRIATAIGGLRWYVTTSRGDELADHPLLRLLERPNPQQARDEWLEAVISARLIAGNAYIERVMVGRTPRELYSLRPDRMAVLAAEGMITPTGYEYRSGSGMVRWDVDPQGQCDLLHWRTFSPTSDWYGVSPLEPAAYAVDQHREAMIYMQAILQNGAAPSGALVAPKEQTMTDDQFARLKEQVAASYAGSRNAGRPMVLEGGLQWQPMGMTPQAIGVLEIRHSAARDICLALGVPPLLLNLPGDSTYTNYSEARIALYEDTVIPMAQSLADAINGWLSPYFGGALLTFDADQVPAMRQKRAELWDMAEKSTITTVNERREMVGYGPIPGGDDVLVQGSVMPLSMAGDISGFGEGEGAEAYGDTQRTE
jgi:HK97 family phage portal protein